MRIEQLRYLSDLQFTNSISKTANRFFLSQQSLSNNIRQLEKELNVTLLERSPFGVILTKEARELLELSDPFLKQYDELQNQFALQSNRTDKSVKQIKILVSSVLVSGVLPVAIAAFQKRHSQVRLSIREASYHEIIPAVKEKKCDIAFLSINEDFFLEQMNEHNADTFHHNIMLTDRLVACASTASSLAAKEVIEQADIAKRPFTYLNVVPLFKTSGNNAQRAMYVSNNAEIHRLLMKEMDVVSLMPRHVFDKMFDNKHYIARPLEGAQQIIYHATLYPETSPHPLLKELASIVASVI